MNSDPRHSGKRAAGGFHCAHLPRSHPRAKQTDAPETEKQLETAAVNGQLTAFFFFGFTNARAYVTIKALRREQNESDYIREFHPRSDYFLHYGALHIVLKNGEKLKTVTLKGDIAEIRTRILEAKHLFEQADGDDAYGAPEQEYEEYDESDEYAEDGESEEYSENNENKE